MAEKRTCLILCPADNVWSNNFMTLLTAKYDVTCFSLEPEKESYKKKCADLGIKLVPNADLAFRRKNVFYKIRFEAKILMKLIRLRHFDVINIQYVDPVYTFICLLIPGNKRKTVISYWGSDLYHTPYKHMRLIRHQINHIKMATFDNVDLMNEYNRFYKGNST